MFTKIRLRKMLRSYFYILKVVLYNFKVDNQHRKVKSQRFMTIFVDSVEY